MSHIGPDVKGTAVQIDQITTATGRSIIRNPPAMHMLNIFTIGCRNRQIYIFKYQINVGRRLGDFQLGLEDEPGLVHPDIDAGKSIECDGQPAN
jgi:hypothetical protein